MAPAHENVTLHMEVLPPASRRALEYLAACEWLRKSSWYLAGGTALALHVGHRQSVDLDFFIPDAEFSEAEISTKFPKDAWDPLPIRKGTVYGKLWDAKVSFIAYPFFVPQAEPSWYGAVRILVPRDLAVMKVIAISQRGTKRDFVDLYWYITHCEPLLDVVSRVATQYPNIDHNMQHIVRSLVYFEDADPDPMPTCFFPADWKVIKAHFQREMPKVARELLGLA